MNTACPADGELERLLANQLDQTEEAKLEAHVVDCESCRERLNNLTKFSGTIPTNPARYLDYSTSPPSAVLARLANSSKPIIRAALPNDTQKDSRSESTWRKLGSSQSLLASQKFLRRQIWTWPLIAAVLLGCVGWWVNRSVESAMRQQLADDLNTFLAADADALAGWMDGQRILAELIASDKQLRPLIEELLPLTTVSSEARNQLTRSPAQGTIRSLLAEPMRTGKFKGFLLVSPSGIALAVDDDAPVGATLSGYRHEFFKEVCSGAAAVSKPFTSPILLADTNGDLRAGLPCMYAAAPIRNLEGQTIAALGLMIRPDDQFTRILKLARPGESGETYAFDRNGLLLSQSRFDDQLKQIGLLVDQADSRSILSVELRDPGVNLLKGNRPSALRKDQRLTRMTEAAVKGVNGIDTNGYRDYRGVEVVGAWKWLDQYDFGIATEIDKEEAFSPLYVLRRVFAVLMGLLTAAAIGIFLAMLSIARHERQLRDATLAAQQLGQYTLLEKLGSGGMGTVYKARHALLRRPTAVKLLSQNSISDTSIARFEREVQLTSGLTHPNTVAVYDYGRTPDGIFYYAMEYLEGVNLDELVRQYGPLPDERVLFILRQVCSSLGEAHAAGVIHRDVKPANILLTVRGGQHDFVKVLDFGLARPVFDHVDSGLTSPDTIAGTPLYVSPEAILGPDRIDARADVYAIGAVGYYLLTGSPVFTGSSAADICLKHVNEAPVPPSARRGHPLNPILEETLLRCLAKSPLDRPANGTDLLMHLESCTVPRSWTATDAARWWSARNQERDPNAREPKSRDAEFAKAFATIK